VLFSVYHVWVLVVAESSWQMEGKALSRSETGPDWTGPGYKLPNSRGLLNPKLLLMLFIREVMEI
jgi:hypothetical protein